MRKKSAGNYLRDIKWPVYSMEGSIFGGLLSLEGYLPSLFLGFRNRLGARGQHWNLIPVYYVKKWFAPLVRYRFFSNL